MRTTALVLLALGCLTLAGCTSSTVGTGPPERPSGSDPAATTAQGTATGADARDTAGTTAELTVEVDDGQGLRTRHRLTCGPAGGDHPDPAAACAALADPAFLAPVPADAHCTALYGGPQTATVSGTLDGRQVHATFSRENGCQIARWEQAGALLRQG